MKTKFYSGSTLINLLLSLAISLIINFSYLVMLILNSSSSNQMPKNPGPGSDLWIFLEFIFYFLLAFMLLTAFTLDLTEEKIKKGSFWKRLLLCVGITVILYFCAPYYSRHNQEIMIVAMAQRKFISWILLKCSFTLVVAVLYGKIFELLYKNQNIRVENEKLKNENLQSRYDVLVTQINPHFFFNSLNSLSSLVRENDNPGALTYIDRLSDTFRYIIQTGKNSITTLREELQFLDAYKYVFEVRYAGKFFIEVDIPEEIKDRTLPSLSLQPLIENAVKHNTITRAQPLHISITARNGYVAVSNAIAPKIEPEEGTGIGLKNLSSRYALLVGREIIVDNDGKTFTVRLPLG